MRLAYILCTVVLWSACESIAEPPIAEPPPPPPPEVLPPPVRPAPACAEIEETRDGGGALLAHTARTHNEWGDLVRERFDRDGDERVDAEVRYVTSEMTGLLLRQETDDPIGGALEHVIRSRYEDGLLVEREHDFDDDGFPDAFEVYAYLPNGELSHYAEDSDGDFNIDFEIRKVFDEDDRLLERTQEVLGVLDERQTYAYAEGALVATTDDRDGDSVFDFFADRLSTEPLIWERKEDLDDDGATDRVFEDRYDGALRLRETVERSEEGPPTTRVVYAYNEFGLSEIGYFRDGARVGEHTFTWDEFGRVIAERADRDGDGVTERLVSARYAPDGRVSERVSRIRGIFGLWLTTEFRDPDGQLVRRIFEDDNDDGAFERTHMERLDVNDRAPVEVRIDEDADGTVDRITLWFQTNC